MILDSYFAVACVLLLAALVGVTAIAANRIRELERIAKEALACYDQAEEDGKRWEQAWEAKSAQLAEARNRIDTLEGELTAQDISHSKAIRAALKNDHRDAKGRYAPAHDPYVNR